MNVILKKSHLFNISEPSPLPVEVQKTNNDPQFFITKFEELYERMMKSEKKISNLKHGKSQLEQRINDLL